MTENPVPEGATFAAGDHVRVDFPDGSAMYGELFPADVEVGDLYLSWAGQRVHFYSRENHSLVGIFISASIERAEPATNKEEA